MTLVYLDTSVWLSIANRKDINHAKANQVMKKVQSGAYVAIISRHVLSEIMDVLRDKLVVDSRVRTTADQAAHRRIAENLFKVFTSRILGMRNVRLRDPSDPTYEILKESTQLVKTIWGTLVTSASCPICKSAYQFIEYDGPHRDDMLHSVLASKMGCDVLITFDHGFSLIQKSPLLSHISIQIL
jgi:predicted nucleic acid-binding protein